MTATSVRVFVIVRSISAPFNKGHTVEVKFATELGAIVEGEVYIRMSPERAKQYAVGDVYTLRMDKV